ncbi:DEAD/DEAH box helicase [uncultured Sulfitobacter sp.]|uniref:DEAD/DEAH box helicase n=1 Tax=uncultured Sulfitobacter sp. TaxID=191468 RepID=UPI0026346B07|nr:DEAD/DEAH box helicase [uncultured Sulfitobacter sp.]
MKQALRAALDDRGYTTLTPVQEAVLDPDLDGKDLLVSAQTGSGKTLGFGLAIAPTVLGEAEAFDAAGAPLALVIAPTRELALQVKRELSWLFAKAGAMLASCVGGMDMRDERRALARGAHIVVATPGRLRDHIMRGSIDLSGLRAVVLDEADEMLDLGFREDLEFILGESPETRQTLLFSATVPKSIGQLAKSYQKDAVRVVTKSEAKQHADIEYRAMMVAERDTENAVINALLYHRAPNAIVFGNTRAMVNRLTTRLSNRGFRVVALSGELSQSERTHALQAMRDGRADVCVATDVAARGIDLPNLDLVVHAELPSNHETLLHRSGRTGRAGRKGTSALVVTNKTRKKAERILGMAKLRAEWATAPSSDEVNAREEERMLTETDWTQDVSEGEQETVGKLVEGFSTEQLAAAYLRLYRAVRSAPEELADVGSKPEPRKPFGPSKWFAVAGGRQKGAEPRRLLPMLCKAGGLSKDDIGAIRIQDDHSVVEIKESSVAGFLETLGQGMNIEGDAVSALDTPPAFAKGPKPGGKGPGKGPRKSAHRGQADGRDEPPKPRGKPTPPTEWNDQPEPRKRKPKPQDRPAKEAASRKKLSLNPDATGGDAPVRARKPRTGPKGPPPPKGKSNSKKNRARALVSKGGKGGPKGGAPKPRRPKDS